jgi:glycolate oxidase FAD binding subunit
MTVRASTAEQLCEIVRDSHDRHARLRIVGRDTWRARSAAIAPDATAIDVSALTGIVAYVPGDLTLTARAGTTIAEIEAATAAHGQWCPLLPWGGDAGTLGATFATATGGPCSAAFGAPRDLAIGVQFVDGTGALVRGGGRMVKNVAGFDLTRLIVGSWGTLGIITEMSVRLRARPAVDETWAVAVEPGATARVDEFRRGPLAPLAIEPFEGKTLVRIGGNAAFVAASRALISTLGSAVQRDDAAWMELRRLDPKPRAPLAASAIGDPLSARVKKQFHPRHILNPGIMGESYA